MLRAWAAAAPDRAALQFVCPDPGWTAHMLQGKPIDVALVVAAAQQAFCAELHAYTGDLAMTVAPTATSASMPLTWCREAIVLSMMSCPPLLNYVAALAPLAKKRALAQMRLSGASIQTNLQRGAGAVPYSQRLCPRGCAAAVDTEQHVLFECQATEAARARYRDALGLDECDMRCLMDKVYQQKDVGLVMDFVYEASNLIPGPTA